MNTRHTLRKKKERQATTRINQKPFDVPRGRYHSIKKEGNPRKKFPITSIPIRGEEYDSTIHDSNRNW